MIYLQLFFEFLKVGAFSFGGGLATIPFLNELADRTGWFSRETLINMLAVSESTPGPIGVNIATYVGYDLCGIFGGLIATLGLITPSVICILIIVRILDRFRDSAVVQQLFTGIRPAAVGLIACAAVEVLRSCLINPTAWANKLFTQLVDWPALILLSVLLFLSNKIKAHPVLFIAIGGVVGIIKGLL